MTAPDFAALLESGSERLLQRRLLPLEQSLLLGYLELLQRWNSAYNLTAVREPAEMVLRHLLDSMTVLPYLGSGGHGAVLDVGTGAGLPGVPLAIFRPQQQFTLLDSIGKKIRFLRQVKRELGLENIHPLQARLETHLPQQPYDIIISRAFASLADFATGCRPLMSPATRLLAMKGQDPLAERKQLPGWIQLDSVQELEVPGLQEQRHLVIMSLRQ